MALFVPLTDLIGTGTQIGNADIVEGEGLYVLEDINIISTNGSAILGSSILDYQMVIEGTVAGDTSAIFFGAETLTVDYNLAIGDNANVTGFDGSAISLSRFFYEGPAALGWAVIDTSGEIRSLGSSAVAISSIEYATIANSGTITGTANGSFGGNAFAFFDVREVSIANTGELRTLPLGGFGDGNGNATISIDFFLVNSDFASFDFTNSGQVLSGGVAIFSRAEDNDIQNTGLIDGDIVIANTGTIKGRLDLINTGDILGDVTNIDSDVTNIQNTGYISGSVLTGFANDVVNTRDGVIDGVISTSLGDDVVYGSALGDTILAGSQNDFVRGRGGNDVIFAQEDDDFVFGGSGNDVLYGGSGNDVLYGGKNADVLIGDADNDTIFGDDGEDALQGGTGNDVLFGGAGDDLLDGGGRSDILSGGAADDTLISGGGADVFVISLVNGTDYVTDFNATQDRIDVSTFGTDFATLSAGGTISQTTAGVFIDFVNIPAQGVIFLEGLILADIDASDFIF